MPPERSEEILTITPGSLLNNVIILKPACVYAPPSTWIPEHSHRCAPAPHHRSISPTWSHGLRNTLRFFKFSFSVCRPVSEDGDATVRPSFVTISWILHYFIGVFQQLCITSSVTNSVRSVINRVSVTCEFIKLRPP